MQPTFNDLMRAKVPIAMCVYYANVRRQRNAWYLVEQFVRREFRGIDDSTVAKLLVIAKAAVREARNLNRKRGK